MPDALYHYSVQRRGDFGLSDAGCISGPPLVDELSYARLCNAITARYRDPDAIIIASLTLLHSGSPEERTGLEWVAQALQALEQAVDAPDVMARFADRVQIVHALDHLARINL